MAAAFVVSHLARVKFRLLPKIGIKIVGGIGNGGLALKRGRSGTNVGIGTGKVFLGVLDHFVVVDSARRHQNCPRGVVVQIDEVFDRLLVDQLFDVPFCPENVVGQTRLGESARQPAKTVTVDIIEQNFLYILQNI